MSPDEGFDPWSRPGAAPDHRAEPSSAGRDATSGPGRQLAPEQRPEPGPDPGPGHGAELERPHPATPLIRGWIVFVAMVFAVGRQVLENWNTESGPSWLFLLLGGLGVALLAGAFAVLGWWFTRFVIDDHEVRIETGVLNKTSKRVPFAKIQSVEVNQPLAARIIGLAELRIEAGGGNAGLNLRYLKRAKAYRLRDYLLARAHGQQTTVEQSSQAPLASAFTDLSSQDRPLVKLQPPILIGGLLTSSEFVLTVGGLVLAMIFTSWLGAGVIALGGLIPIAIAVVQMIGRRVVAQFNYTLAATVDGGLRVTRGLTNLSSQSIPVDRIQGVCVSQSWLWRHLLRFHRVDIDLVGQRHEAQSSGSISGMLLPVAHTEQVRITMGHLLPRSHDESIEMIRVPRRAAWLRPIGWRTMKYGWNDEVMVNELGWIHHRRNIVPHAKTQSVRLSQGPIQRLLGLASVHIDTTPGPVRQSLLHLDAETARRLVTEQLPRAAAARRRG